MHPAPEPLPRRRDQILRAAHTLGHAGGVDAITIDGVVRLAGASIGSIYHHYRNLDALRAAVLREYTEAYAATLAPVLQAASPEAFVRGLVEHHVAFVTADPARARLMDALRAHPGVRAQDPSLPDGVQRLAELVRERLQPAIADGAVRELPAPVLLHLLLAPTTSYMRAWTQGTDHPHPREAVAALADGAWAALRT